MAVSGQMKVYVIHSSLTVASSRCLGSMEVQVRHILKCP